MKISQKQIIVSKTIDRPISRVWQQWSTSEGLKTFFGRDNKMELKIGGAFEIYFLLDNPYGLKGAEGCKVISFVEEKQIVFTWNAPPQYPDIRNADYKTWVVVDMEKLGENSTKVTLTHAGWPEDAAWNPVFEYFENAWQTVIKSLQSSS